MIEDMTVRNFVEKTRNDYIRQVKTFTSLLLRIVGALSSAHILGTLVPMEEPSTASGPDVERSEASDAGVQPSGSIKLRHYVSWPERLFLTLASLHRMYLPLQRDVPKSPFGANDHLIAIGRHAF
jgi:hypothetical protein